MLQAGHSYDLKVVKRVEFGVYLDAKNLGEVLLPNRVVPEGVELGNRLHVFLYFDSEDRLIATTRTPKAEVGQFAYLQVIDATEFGAFLDWGLDKHLLVPFGEQHRNLEVGRSYLVYVALNPSDGRIVASSKVDKYVNESKKHSFKPRQAVSLIIANSTDLGFKAVINGRYWGMLYKKDVFQRLSFGQTIQGFIQRVRSDGKIDLTLNGGYQARDANSRIVLDHLKKTNGFAPLHDKSDPKIIAATLGMSKAAFKQAIAGLYKQRVIVIQDDGIRLVHKVGEAGRAARPVSSGGRPREHRNSRAVWKKTT